MELVLDRIKKAFVEGAKQKGPVAHALLNLAVNYKIKWHKKGYRTPFLNRLFFKKFQDALGGRIYMIATGGAPLNQETQDFVIACLDCKFVVGYGLTECTALCTISPPGRTSVENDLHTGRPLSIRNPKMNSKSSPLSRITIRALPEDLDISFGTCQTIIKNDLHLKRSPAKFVPHLLTNEQKGHRKETCKNMVEMFNSDPHWFKNVITGDETLVCGYDPETKRQSKPGELRFKKVRMIKSKLKCLLITFFDVKGLVHYEFVPEGQTINKHDYLDVSRRLRKPVILEKVATSDWQTGRKVGASRVRYWTIAVSNQSAAGGYSTKDKPYPRGEVVVGGKSVTVGYFNNPELTKKVYEEKDGIWWFYTGDIGELLPGNRLRLIDRRKDLVKLSTGEYVALGQVESRLKSCPEVDNMCVSAAAQNRLLALVVPNYEVLKQRFGSGRSLGDMCRDPAVVRYISSMLREHGLMSGLNSREIPADCRLVADDWTPDSGLVTAALKLKRHSIEDYYRDHIQEMMNNVSSP
ncbi:ACSL4 [Cordylochernes scorpioides]|uniref:long-chain-fatty-acid--CoA ligase n=1 Tax=Cordylochernes scorpioides TaxID=51811 RepID=A0ABY6KRF0_9ARAC|nr:ACSL4 [Cordylochernes scorpioides]